MASEAGAALWRFLLNPYCVSAAAAGLFAVAVSVYISRHREPLPPPRPRVVSRSHTRLSPSQFVFRTETPASPLLLCTERRALFTLTPYDKDAPSQPNPDLVQLQDSLFRPELLAQLDNLRILQSGLHHGAGRHITVSDSHTEHTFAFPTRLAAQHFHRLLTHAHQQTPPPHLNLFLTTFNVGNKQPPDDLSPWLQSAHSAHLIAIGVQECSYNPSSTASSNPAPEASTASSSASDVSSTSTNDDTSTSESPSSSDPSSITNSTAQPPSSTARDHWFALLTAHFPEDKYACIVNHYAWDRCLTIFVPRHLLKHVSNARIDIANVGLGGVAANKGAIGARFKLFDTDFLIINSHLAAHHKEVLRRNVDFTSIASGLRDLRDHHTTEVLADPVHYTFWMGDLNYRINLDRDVVLNHVQAAQWQPLQQADQLLQQMAEGRAFQGFSEGPTNFAPTYRYESGSRRYSSVKLRIPSYCDRILYRALPGCNLELQEYKPADEIMTSDHSPVFATFRASTSCSTLHHAIPDIESESEEPSASEQTPLLLKSRSLSLRPKASPRSSSQPRKPPLQLVFISLGASNIPDMDNGGRRIAVAKALRIENHLIWRKHDEMGEGHNADPYCAFHGSAVAELDEGEYRTDTIPACQSPVWSEEQIPAVDLATNDRNALRSMYVTISVKDENPVRRDGTIGFANLWLGSVDGEQPVEFSVPIMQGGLQRGLIEGKYFVR